MRITVVGTGYVGLVTGACFAEMGHHVTCVDVDEDKIAALRQGIIPIYEPGLETIVKDNLRQQRLEFTLSLADAMAESRIYFIAVGTPPGEDGSADLQHVLNVATQIGANLSDYAIIVNKSTVPVGTADKVQAAIQAQLDSRGIQQRFDVVSNPEFLKEGNAVEDFMRPDRIIVGAASAEAEQVMRQLYAPFNRNHDRTIFMGVRDAEMTKYAANAMLATKISFINEIAALCDCLDVDVEAVRRGIGSDSRIGFSFIYPGCGYGGSCFPKDVKALAHMAQCCNFEPQLLNAIEERNRRQKQVLFNKVVQRFGTNLNGLIFAVWGLAFKPGTDDMREAPSIPLINNLLAAGATVHAYDPVAMDAARDVFASTWQEQARLTFAAHQYQALEESDAMLLVTEWKPFRAPDYQAMQNLMRQKIIFDGRNQYQPQQVKEAGFEYFGIGRR